MKLRDLIAGIFSIALFIVVIYGMWWLAKNGSYFIWYEGMVQETIKEMVKPEYLIK